MQHKKNSNKNSFVIFLFLLKICIIIFLLAELQTMIRIAPLFHNFRNPANIRNPRIYCINRYFLMFGGYQGPTSYHASMNEFGLWYPCIIVCAARGNYDRLCHIVCRFVFVNHLCVILFFCLDVI